MVINIKKSNTHSRILSIVIVFCFIWIITNSGLIEIQNIKDADTMNVVNENTISPCIKERIYETSSIDYSALWNRTYGGFEQDRVYDIIRCSDDGFVMVGYTASFTEGDSDIWVIKTDEQGEVVWTTTIGTAAEDESGNAIIECENGDFVIAGVTVSGTYYNARLDRITAEGEEVWTYQFGDDLLNDYFANVLESSSGNLLAIGNTESYGAGGQDVLAIYLDRNGNEIWTRTYGGSDEDLAKSVVECNDGGYAILASTRSKGAGDYDFWLIRIDESGTISWDFTYGGIYNDVGYQIISYYNLGFVMVGITLSFGDALGDFYVIRVSKYGVVLWEQNFDDGDADAAYGITLCSRGGFAVIGTVDVGTGTSQVKVLRLDPSLVETGSYYYGGAAADYGYSIIESRPEEFIVAGYTNSYGAGSYDAWLFLIPGLPEFVNTNLDYYFEFGDYPYIDLYVESTAEIDSWWMSDTSHFNITGGFGGYGAIYTLTPPDVDFYELTVYVNNTAGYEAELYLWIEVYDSIPPYWTEIPENQTVEYGDALQYQLEADDISGIDHWSLTGSSEFEIDSNGIIINNQSLEVAEYQLEISVYDTYHHVTTCCFTVTVVDTTAPEWTQEPEDQTINFGDAFIYNLNATDLSGIIWTVDDTSRFTVDWQGRIRSIVPLSVGDHGVSVHAIDPYGNTLDGTFTITVLSPSTATTGVTLFQLETAAILFVAGSVATMAVVMIFYLLGKRRTPSK